MLRASRSKSYLPHQTMCRGGLSTWTRYLKGGSGERFRAGLSKCVDSAPVEFSREGSLFLSKVDIGSGCFPIFSSLWFTQNGRVAFARRWPGALQHGAVGSVDSLVYVAAGVPDGWEGF